MEKEDNEAKNHNRFQTGSEKEAKERPFENERRETVDEDGEEDGEEDDKENDDKTSRARRDPDSQRARLSGGSIDGESACCWVSSIDLRFKDSRFAAVFLFFFAADVNVSKPGAKSQKFSLSNRNFDRSIDYGVRNVTVIRIFLPRPVSPSRGPRALWLCNCGAKH